MKITLCTCSTRAQTVNCKEFCNSNEIIDFIELFENWQNIVSQYNAERLNVSDEKKIDFFIEDSIFSKNKYFNATEKKNILLYWLGWIYETAQICPERLNFPLQTVINIFLQEKQNKTF